MQKDIIFNYNTSKAHIIDLSIIPNYILNCEIFPSGLFFMTGMEKMK